MNNNKKIPIFHPRKIIEKISKMQNFIAIDHGDN